MKNITFIIVTLYLSNILNAFEFKNLNYLQGVLGEIKSSNNKYNINRFSVNSYNDFIVNNSLSVTSTLNYTTTSQHYSRSYNRFIQEECFFELSEFMLNYQYNNNVISIGAFTFKEGKYSEHFKIGLSQSDALMTLYYINMKGIFYTHYKDNIKYQIGYAFKSEDIYILTEDRYKNAKEDSDLAYLFITHKINKKLESVLNISTSNITSSAIYNPNIIKSIGILTLLGIGLEWNDQANTGKTFYGIAGLSHTIFDSSILTSNNKKVIIPNMSFNKKNKQIGYSILIGASKSFDNIIYKKTIFINGEYFYASQNWASYVTDSKNFETYGWGHLGHTFKGRVGLEINPTTNLSIIGKYTKFTHKKKIGGNETIILNDFDKTLLIRLDLLF